MSGPTIVIGSRGSALALTQARLVEAALAREGWASRIVTIESEGDRLPPDTAWGEGVFVAAIERELLAGRIDLAVHSAKDMPTDEHPRLQIGAYLPRADPRDALVVRGGSEHRRLAELPSGARVGTDSPRRTGFLLAHRADLNVHPLNGNVDTRLRRLDAGETDALVLACAGLDRLGLGDRIVQRLDPEIVPPAPGQGALAVQIRRDHAGLLGLMATIDDPHTRLAVEAERAFLAASGGGCRAPIGALATILGDELSLVGGYAAVDGASARVISVDGPAANGGELGRELARELGTLLPRGSSDGFGPVDEQRQRPRVLVTRPADQSGAIVSALRDAGIDSVVVPTISVELEPGGGDLDEAVRNLGRYEWVVITSPNGARAFLEAARRVQEPGSLPRFAAVGPVTRASLEAGGIDVEFEPRESNVTSLAAQLPLTPGAPVLVVRGDLAGDRLARALRGRGTDVDDVIAYRTHEAPEASRSLLRRALADGPIDAVILTSGSTVRGLVALAAADPFEIVRVPAISIGRETAAEARRAGFSVLATASTPEATALAQTTASAIHSQAQEMR